jgi:hypothetical protein
MLDFRQRLINSTLRKVLKRLHYPLGVMLTSVRWYVAYPLSLRHIEEMMQERGVFVDHVTVHRWAIKVGGSGRFVASAQATRWAQMEDGRDLHQGFRPVEIPLPRRRSGCRHVGLSQWPTRVCSQPVLPSGRLIIGSNEPLFSSRTHYRNRT